ncbi:MAG TPA: mechanosensitive ion channel family protein [Rhizomicrobium sp.]|nr:mechanosensitive ion channel family protein [Rhizomicrobium sp.]
MSLSAITSHIAAAIHWLPPWGRALGVFSLIVAAGSLAQVAIVWFLGRCAKNWHPLARAMFLRVRTVIRFAVLFLALAVALPLVPLGAHGQDVGHKLLVALFIVLMGWIALVLADILIDNYVARFRVDVADNLLARKAVTQMRVLRRAVSVTIILVTAGFALMSFDAVRQFGFSLFASAGVAGIVAGLAARPLLSNLIAGIQLAMTQPIRIEDAVVIDKEWGWVEEFTSTYVVIRLWDWRRQIVPLSYFLDNVYTNWTRSGSNIIGSVYLYLDYATPIAPLRAEAERIVRASKLWDGQVVNLQVSDAKEHTIEIRVLASASDSSRAWDLRCEVREKLLDYIRREMPSALLRYRDELTVEADRRQAAE